MSKTLYRPVVGCAGIADERARTLHHQWFVTDDTWNLLEGDAAGRLPEVSVSMMLGYLVLRAEGMLRLDIPMDVIEDDDSVRRQASVAGQAVDAIDEGDLAAAWFTRFLGTPCRLLKVHPDAYGKVNWPAA